MKKLTLTVVTSCYFLLINSAFSAEEKTQEITEKLQTQLVNQQKKLKEIEKQLRQIITQSRKKSASVHSASKLEKNWQIKSYGSLLYKSQKVFSNTQDLEPTTRATTDLEKVVLEFNYKFSPKWQMEVELEYEHGGTGVALEYDGFEEFGEFETEIEAGGEVLVEKLEAKYQHNDNFAIKFGHIFVPVGLGTQLHKPNQYLTTERHWSESALIPQVWHETGVNLIGTWQNFTAQALITTGLNSEYFRTYKWVASGHQKRFEKVNADDLAMTLSLDYGDLKSASGFGASFYSGNTSGNRNNTNKIQGNGKLTIMGLHGVLRYKNWLLRSQYLYGKLEDSQAITQANKTTPGLKPGNFALLGSAADSAFAEASYNSQQLFNLSKPLYIFAAYEYANPVKEVASGIATQRFNIQEYIIGVNYHPIKNIVLKAQVAEQNYAQDNLKSTHSFSLSLGYNFSI